MKVSLNLMQYYVDKYHCGPKLAPNGIDNLVEKIGRQLGAVEEVIDLGKRYQGIVIAKVINCQKHPDADKLSICKIDDGGKVQSVERDEQGHIQVVCGAPNVRAGMMVAWLPPGTTVPSTIDKDPFVLESRDIRGQKSNGMIASGSELAINDDHEGIVEIDEKDAKPGDDFAEIYKLNDYVIDIENKMFTHRADCFGQLGVAREITGIEHQAFVSPDWYKQENVIDVGHNDSTNGLEVDVQIPELCPRYMAIAIDGVTIEPSPLWLQSYLSRLGVRPINNVVDMTNYIMLLTGQPLHAFDFDKIAVSGKAKIIVRKPRAGEKLALLNGKTIEPKADTILICDQDKPIALGGVMGGLSSEVDDTTKRIIIECANFDMYSVRKTSMEQGLFTDAVTRFSKGQSEWQCPRVLYLSAQMMKQLCLGATPKGPVIDVHHPKKQNKPIQVSSTFINERLGLELKGDEMANLLQNVEFAVETKVGELSVLAPFWRTDIEIPEDIVEEVGRLHGYNQLPLELPKRSIHPVPKNSFLELKTKIRNVLRQAGANELLTYSFVHANLLDKSGQDPTQAFALSNALSPDLQYFRMSLTPSLLDKTHLNLKSDMVRASDNEFALFEIGKAHIKNEPDPNEPDLPKEVNSLAFVFSADDKTAKHKYLSAPYYMAKRYLNYVLESFGAENKIRIEPLEGADLYNNSWLVQMTAPYDPKRCTVLRDEKGLVWGVLGEFKILTKKGFKLAAFTSGFEIDPTLLLASHKNSYTPLPKFPKVEQDITLKVPAGVNYAELFDFLSLALNEVKPENTFLTLGPVDIYQDKLDKDHKNISLRLWLSAYDRTLIAEGVNSLLDDVAEKAKQKFGAERL